MITRREFLKQLSWIIGGLAGLTIHGCGYDFLKGNVSDKEEIAFWIDRKGKNSIVFNHGFLGNHKKMEQYSDFFKEKKYTTLLWDFPGHFESSNYPDNRKYSIENFSENLEEIISKNKLESPLIMGYSLGGMVALDYSSKFDNYSGLILLSTSYIGSESLRNYLVSRFNKSAKGRVFIDGREFDPRMFIELGVDILNYRIDISKINKPVLFVGGDRDEFYPLDVMEDLIDNLKNVRYEILENVGHDLPYSHKKEVLDFIIDNFDFLK